MFSYVEKINIMIYTLGYFVLHQSDYRLRRGVGLIIPDDVKS